MEQEKKGTVVDWNRKGEQSCSGNGTVRGKARKWNRIGRRKEHQQICNQKGRGTACGKEKKGEERLGLEQEKKARQWTGTDRERELKWEWNSIGERQGSGLEQEGGKSSNRYVTTVERGRHFSGIETEGEKRIRNGTGKKDMVVDWNRKGKRAAVGMEQQGERHGSGNRFGGGIQIEFSRPIKDMEQKGGKRTGIENNQRRGESFFRN